MTANGNGSIGGGAIQFQLKLQNTDLTVDLNFKGRQTMNDQPEILKMIFDNDMVLSQPEIKYENYKYEIVFYVKPDADLSKLQLTPIIELSKGAIVRSSRFIESHRSRRRYGICLFQCRIGKLSENPSISGKI